mgnify:CR=1 FL=1
MSDFLQKNSAFLLSVIGILGVCGSAVLRFVLKSRCIEIKCCGCYIKRDVIPADQIELSVPASATQNQI